MTLDIRGSLKNTKISSNSYTVFEELLSNAIDSFLIRRHKEPSLSDFEVKFEIEFFKSDLLDDEDLKITCKDNGGGLSDEDLKSFLTKDTSYKDDLPIPGIEKCKGAGRIQFFHHFRFMDIESTYRDGDNILKRSTNYQEPQKQLNFEDFKISNGFETEIGTKISLSELKGLARKRMPQGHLLSEVFSAAAIKRRLFVAFLQRFVSLKRQLGDFAIHITTHHWSQPDTSECLKQSDVPIVSEVRDVQIKEQDPNTGRGLVSCQELKISHYKLDKTTYDLPKNAIAFCAKSSPVKEITNRYLRTRSEQNSPVNDNYHIILIEGQFLDDHVNERRDDFDNIPEEIPAEDFLFDTKISYSKIFEEIDPIIDGMVTPSGWKKEDVIVDMKSRFGVSEGMLADTDTRILYGDRAEAVVERVLKKYQEKIIVETGEIFKLKQEIFEAQPDSDEFRNKIHEMSWKYASSLRNFDMASLSQLVVRRAAIVEILALACGKKLDMQAGDRKNRRKDEKIIHSIFFPMRKDSRDVLDHDMWLLSEEYQYYDYISSDKSLAKIEWDDGKSIFEADVDDEFAKILNRRSEENGKKRPDIAIFNKEGSAIIIEFKAPGVSMDEHIGDLYEYAHLLAAKSRRKLKKFYGYLVGDTLNPLRMGGWTQFPVGKGYFQSTELRDPTNGQVLGEIYSELLYFDDLVDRARKRIRIYQSKLNVDFSTT